MTSRRCPDRKNPQAIHLEATPAASWMKQNSPAGHRQRPQTRPRRSGTLVDPDPVRRIVSSRGQTVILWPVVRFPAHPIPDFPESIKQQLRFLSLQTFGHTSPFCRGSISHSQNRLHRHTAFSRNCYRWGRSHGCGRNRECGRCLAHRHRYRRRHLGRRRIVAGQCDDHPRRRRGSIQRDGTSRWISSLNTSWIQG